MGACHRRIRMSAECPTIRIELPSDTIEVECELAGSHAYHMAFFGEDVIAAWDDNSASFTQHIDYTTGQADKGSLVVRFWNTYQSNYTGTVNHLRILVEALKENKQIQSMSLYTQEIREPHDRNGWALVESWNYTQLEASRGEI